MMKKKKNIVLSGKGIGIALEMKPPLPQFKKQKSGNKEPIWRKNVKLLISLLANLDTERFESKVEVRDKFVFFKDANIMEKVLLSSDIKDKTDTICLNSLAKFIPRHLIATLANSDISMKYIVKGLSVLYHLVRLGMQKEKCSLYTDLAGNEVLRGHLLDLFAFIMSVSITYQDEKFYPQETNSNLSRYAIDAITTISKILSLYLKHEVLRPSTQQVFLNSILTYPMRRIIFLSLIDSIKLFGAILIERMQRDIQYTFENVLELMCLFCLSEDFVEEVFSEVCYSKGELLITLSTILHALHYAEEEIIFLLLRVMIILLEKPNPPVLNLIVTNGITPLILSAIVRIITKYVRSLANLRTESIIKSKERDNYPRGDPLSPNGIMIVTKSLDILNIFSQHSEIIEEVIKSVHQFFLELLSISHDTFIKQIVEKSPKCKLLVLFGHILSNLHYTEELPSTTILSFPTYNKTITTSFKKVKTSIFSFSIEQACSYYQSIPLSQRSIVFGYNLNLENARQNLLSIYSHLKTHSVPYYAIEDLIILSDFIDNFPRGNTLKEEEKEEGEIHPDSVRETNTIMPHKKPLTGLSVILSIGVERIRGKNAFTRLIKRNGGRVYNYIANKVTYCICTPDEIKGKQRISSKVQNSIRKELIFVRPEFIDACILQGKVVPVDTFILHPEEHIITRAMTNTETTPKKRKSSISSIEQILSSSSSSVTSSSSSFSSAVGKMPSFKKKK